MRGLRFFRLSELLERLFGPKVAEFFDNFGFYFVIAFITVLSLILIYLWFDFFKDIVRRLRRKQIQPKESVEEVSINLKKERLKKFFIVLLILIILIFVVGLVLSNQVDCEDRNATFSQQIGNYSEKALESLNKGQTAVSLSYVNELITEYEYQKQFLEDNKKCISIENPESDINKVSESLIIWKGIQIQLIANLNN